MAKVEGINKPSETQAKNYILNGNFDIWQAKTTFTSSGTSFTNDYTADNVRSSSSTASASHNITSSRSTNVPTVTQSGFLSTYSYLITNNSVFSTFAAGDYIRPFITAIEGYNFVPLFGKLVTFSFWTKASVIGSYSFSLNNGLGSRAYTTTFPINTANTWEKKSITIQMDSSGTWNQTQGIGLGIVIGAKAGSTFSAPSDNSWLAGNYIASSSATNYFATNGSTLQIAQLMLNLGPIAAPFSTIGDSMEEELALCQRYYEKSYDLSTVPGTATGVNAVSKKCTATTDWITVQQKTRKRDGVTPAIVIYSTSTGASGSVRDVTASVDRAASTFSVGEVNINVQTSGLTVGNEFNFQYVIDSRL